VRRVRRLSAVEVASYDLVPPEIARRAVLVRVPVLPPRADGMTSGRFVFLRNDEPTDGTSRLIAHELVHVRQFRDLGRVGFALRYFSAYFRNLARFHHHRRAYLEIPQEQEAYDRARAWDATRLRRAASALAAPRPPAAPAV
jgi:Domain of unknown function (DUF4157)